MLASCWRSSYTRSPRLNVKDHMPVSCGFYSKGFLSSIENGIASLFIPLEEQLYSIIDCSNNNLSVTECG